MPKDTLLTRVRAVLQEALVLRDTAITDERRRWIAIGLSVLVAFVLWFTFSMRETYSVVVEMPVEVRSLPAGRALSRMPPERARVTVQGEGWDLLKLQRSPPTLRISAQEAQVDLLAAASESSDMPTGISVQSAVPGLVQLELEPEVTRTVPIVPRAQVAPAPLFDLIGPARVEPDSVRVIGARSVVNALRAWPTVPLERDEVRGTVTAVVPLADTLRGLVRRNVQQVRMTVPAALFTEATRELEVRTEAAPPGAPPIRYIPARVEVTYRIPVEQYERSLETADFYAVVPYAVAVNDTTGSVQPVLHLPEGLHVRDARIAPRRLQYRIRVD